MNSRLNVREQALCHLRIFVEAGNNAEQNQHALIKPRVILRHAAISQLLHFSAVIENMLVFFANQRGWRQKIEALVIGKARAALLLRVLKNNAKQHAIA
jgi:hypothetical protein